MGHFIDSFSDISSTEAARDAFGEAARDALFKESLTGGIDPKKCEPSLVAEALYMSFNRIVLPGFTRLRTMSISEAEFLLRWREVVSKGIGTFIEQCYRVSTGDVTPLKVEPPLPRRIVL